MHFLFVSHQSDQPFLRYGQSSVLNLKKNTSENVKENLRQNNSFLQPWLWVKVMEMSSQYVLPVLCILCPKYLRCNLNGFDLRGESRWGGGPAAAEMN